MSSPEAARSAPPIRNTNARPSDTTLIEMVDLPERFQPQTFRQFVASYNEIATAHLASPATTRVDLTTGTKGAITDPERRLAPERIEPWTDFDREQERGIIATVLREVDGIGADTLAFPARYYVDRVGEDLGRLDSENALLLFDNDTLHKPATRLLRVLLANNRIRTALARRQQQQQQPADTRQADHAYRPGKVSFTTHLNRLRQSAGRKRKRDAALIAPVLGPADVFCIFESESPPPSDSIIVASPSTGVRSNAPELLFLKEAKASHKLTDTIINQAVAGNRTLEPRAIMGRGGGDPDDTEDCEYWFAAVCAQIYTSMIDKGLRYGIISTGARYVFVSIDPDDLSTMRYSLCRASSDITVSPLMRIVSLALLAIQHGLLPTSRRLDSIRDGGGLIWTTATASFTTTNSPDPQMRAETESWKDSPSRMDDRSPSSFNQPSDQGSTSLAYNRAPTSVPPALGARQNVSLALGEGLGSTVDNPNRREDCAFPPPATPPPPRPAVVEAQRRGSHYPSPPPQGESVPGKRSRQDDHLDVVDDMSAQPAKRTKTDNGIGLAASPPSPASPSRSLLPAQHIGRRDRQFCTQKCLKSLMLGPDQQRPPADTTCPNYADHQSGVSLTDEQLCQKLRAQLTTSVDDAPPQFSHGYEFLNFMSGHTQMIKLRLGSSGHVLLAKAFMPSDLRVMRREARFYAHLRHLQGRYVPVCMGTIELPPDKALTYDGFRFTDLLLLSWAGTGPDQWRYVGGGLGHGGEADHAFVRALTVEVRKALAEIHKAGVLHRDVALRNVLVRHFALEGTSSCPEWRLQVSMIDFESSRTRAMYRHHATQRLQGRSRGRDLNQQFAEALAKEMDKCADAIGKWCPVK